MWFNHNKTKVNTIPSRVFYIFISNDAKHSANHQENSMNSKFKVTLFAFCTLDINILRKVFYILSSFTAVA